VMLTRLIGGASVMFALLGIVTVPEASSHFRRRRIYALHQVWLNDNDAPWDLTDWVPVGWMDSASTESGEWSWYPRFERMG